MECYFIKRRTLHRKGELLLGPRFYVRRWEKEKKRKNEPSGLLSALQYFYYGFYSGGGSPSRRGFSVSLGS